MYNHLRPGVLHVFQSATSLLDVIKSHTLDLLFMKGLPQFHTLKFVYRTDYYYMCEKSSVKFFVIPEEAAHNLINCPQWLNCSVGDVGSRF